MITSPPFEPPSLTAGVDTHTDTHTLAILGAHGGVLLTEAFAADHRGYNELIKALQNAGSVKLVGVEGTNSYGAGLTRALTTAGYTVKEVLRPTRQVRRINGKSDSIDAVEAARSSSPPSPRWVTASPLCSPPRPKQCGVSTVA